ncbi:MAG: apolipoprotein N-acyltransferase [Rhodospirillales bacterium]|nr:apolipoprotein N-acyltransferase [Rhodospirillales bacterium]
MRAMINLRDMTIALTGWRRRAAAFILGAIAVLALPPVHFVPALVPALVGLSWLIDGSKPSTKSHRLLKWRRGARFAAYSVGCWFGLGFFAFGLYWIAYSFLVDSANFAWMIPFALVSLSGVLSIYIGLTALACFAFTPAGPWRIAGLAFWWTVFEWLRAWLFTGFPWNLMGTVWAQSGEMIQVTSVVGVFGLSLITVAAAASPAVFGLIDVPRKYRLRLLIVTWGVLAAVWIGGAVRLGGASDGTVEDVYLRLVQPNIAQKDKWKPDLRAAHLENLLSLSRTAKTETQGAQVSHIIWPETAVPLFLNTNPPAVRALSMVVPDGGALLTGAVRLVRNASGGVKIWNSLHIIDGAAEFKGTYDKHHLVPFGEYVPFNKILKLSKLTAGRTDFSAGVGSSVLQIPGAPPVSPLICYEAIFPGAVISDAVTRPGWMLNITNDAWFGASSGPYQHFAAVRFRAVEEGMPLVRVANTGLSGVIDSYGRVKVKTRLNQRIAVNSKLPKSIASRTVYSRIGNISLVMILFVYIAVFPGIFYFDSKQILG